SALSPLWSLLIFHPFFFSCSVVHRSLHSFPTRRSSDLLAGLAVEAHDLPDRELSVIGECPVSLRIVYESSIRGCHRPILVLAWRSEEHTSELQSRVDLVCRLLLEKKKKKKNKSTKSVQH